MSGYFNAWNIVLVLPCIAVLVGMKYLGSAWAAILLYHAVILPATDLQAAMPSSLRI